MSNDINVEDLLRSIDLPPTFLDELYSDSDWSFVIKTHALFESVLGALIVKRLQLPTADDVIAHLDFNNTKSGKVAFARSLGLLSKEHVSFLRGLSELRNMLVHKIHNVSFTFTHYVAKLDESDLKGFKKAFGYAICGLDNGETEYSNALKKNPKIIIFIAAYRCLLNLQFQIADHSKNMLVEALRNHKTN